MDVKQIGREVILQGKKYTIEKLTVQYPNDRIASYEVIDHPGAVAMVPVGEDGRIMFVRQYRAAIGIEILEVPAGTIDPGEAPEVCAMRELQEEIGMAAEKLDLLGGYYLAPGYSSEYMHFYLASGLRPDSLEPDQDEYLSIVSYSQEEVFQMLAAGEIKDAKSALALTLAKGKLNKSI